MSSAAVGNIEWKCQDLQVSIMGNDSSNKATSWGISPCLTVNVCPCSSASFKFSSSKSQMYCLLALWRSLKVQKEWIDDTAERNSSSKMFHHPTNPTILCLQKCHQTTHHLNGCLMQQAHLKFASTWYLVYLLRFVRVIWFGNCMAWSTHGLLIQRFSDLCESLAVAWRIMEICWVFQPLGF